MGYPEKISRGTVGVDVVSVSVVLTTVDVFTVSVSDSISVSDSVGVNHDFSCYNLYEGRFKRSAS